jgi:chromosome segregation protein
LQEEVNTVSSQYKRKQEEVYQLNKTLEIYEIQYSTLKQEYEKTSSDDQANSVSLHEFESKLTEVTKLLDQKNREFEDLQKQEEEIQEKCKKLEEEIEEIREKLTLMNRKLDAKQNEHSLTKSMVENLEGFPEAIKFLKKNSNWGKDASLPATNRIA